jgi:hypothetical protein
MSSHDPCGLTPVYLAPQVSVRCSCESGGYVAHILYSGQTIARVVYNPQHISWIETTDEMFIFPKSAAGGGNE